MEASRPRAPGGYARGPVLTRGKDDHDAEAARLTALAIVRIDDGTPGYRLENPFGQTVQVMPRPPGFRATLTLEWEGALPDEIIALIERAKTSGMDVSDLSGKDQ